MVHDTLASGHNPVLADKGTTAEGINDDTRLMRELSFCCGFAADYSSFTLSIWLPEYWNREFES